MSEIKAPNFLATYGLFDRLGELLTFGKIAQSCGKEVQTAEAWGREPASNANPAGSGRRNPIDCILRLMGLAHKENDRVLVREIAETFTDYADYLNGIQITDRREIAELAGASVKEHGEAIFEALNLKKPNYPKAMTEIVQAEIALRDLKEKVRGEMLPVRALAKGVVDIRRTSRG